MCFYIFRFDPLAQMPYNDIEVTLKDMDEID